MRNDAYRSEVIKSLELAGKTRLQVKESELQGLSTALRFGSR